MRSSIREAAIGARGRRRTGPVLRAAALVAWITAAGAARLAAQVGAEGPTASSVRPTADPVPAAEVPAWRADLSQLAEDLVAYHGDAFHATTPEALAAAVSSLDARIPRLARHEIIVGMQRIVASIGDGHTSVSIFFDAATRFHALPVRLGLYEEGLFIEAGAARLGSVIGSRIVAIGEVPVGEAIDRVTPLVSRDNDVWLRTMVPLYLMLTEVLHAVGLTEDPMSASLTVDGPEGRRTVRLEARPDPFVIDHGSPVGRVPGWVEARTGDPQDAPLYLRHPDRFYWREYLPDARTLYIQYNQVNDAPHGPGVAAFFADAFGLVDAERVERVVLDVRANSGGEGMLNYAVVREILRRPSIDRPGGLFVIIGRRTFSAAQALVHDLDLWTDAIFVGEPTGSSPQFWGDHRFFRLEHSGIAVSASPTWWQPGGPYDRRAFLPPELTFEPRWSDYVANRDPALEAILGWDERVTLEDLVLEALPAGVEPGSAAADAVRGWSRDPVHRYASATGELNALGYRLLRQGRGDEALDVFRLNVSVHPEYANGWDSLGEALLGAGRRDEGLAAYRRAYELDPRVGRAAEVLGRIGPPPTGK